MAKYKKVSGDLLSLFVTICDKTTIPHCTKFEVLYATRQRELYKIIKMNNLFETLNDSINFAIVFNKEILEQLSKDYQEMAIDDCLAGVFVSETDKISLEKPNFDIYMRILGKYGYDKVIALCEKIKSKMA